MFSQLTRKTNLIAKTVKRHNQLVPNVANLLKEKGTVIPFPNKLLKPDEFERYELYRNIKLGNYQWLKEHIDKHPLKDEERQSLVEYINDLKKSSFSAPNVLIGGTASLFAIKAIGLCHGFGIALVATSSFDKYFTLLNIPLSGIIIVDIAALFCIKYGANVILDELRSPYYNYDEMLRICKKVYSIVPDQTKQCETKKPFLYADKP